MGPDKNKNTGAAFERTIDSLFFGEGGPDKEPSDDEYIEFIEEPSEDDASDDAD